MRVVGPGSLFWSLPSGLILFLISSLISSSHSSPINRQAGISENVFITVQNDTYGNEQRVCSIESMTYEDGESIPTSSPCEHCICRPPGFACTIISCEYRPGCKAMKRSNQCCPEYQCECEKDGKIYQNGEKILDENNPCEVCYCQGGDVVCAVIDCYWRNDCQPRYIENRCCPLYDHCAPPSEIGPIRPTQRPLITSPTTVAPSILWFNLSSAVYETKPTTEKPIRFQTSTQLVPVPDVPMDHNLVPTQDKEGQVIQGQEIPSHVEEFQPPKPTAGSEENKFSASIESGLIQSPQTELTSSGESIEPVQPQILEFPAQETEVEQHHIPQGRPPQSEESEPSQEVNSPPDIQSEVPASVQPEIVQPVQEQPIGGGPDEPAQIQPEIQFVEQKISESSRPVEPEVVQDVLPEEPKPVVMEVVVQSQVLPQEPVQAPVEPVDSHDDVQRPVQEVSQENNVQSGEGQQEVAPAIQVLTGPEQVEIVHAVPVYVPAEIVPVKSQEQEGVVSSEVPEQPVPSAEVVPSVDPEVSTEVPVQAPVETVDLADPVQEVEVTNPTNAPVINEVQPEEQVHYVTSGPVQVQEVDVEANKAVEEIAATSVSHVEDSSNILEVPPAVLESSEPPVVIPTAVDGFVTSLSTETVVPVAATSDQSDQQILPSTTIITDAPSIVVFGTVPAEPSEDEQPSSDLGDSSDNSEVTSTPVIPVVEEVQQPETPAPVVVESDQPVVEVVPVKSETSPEVESESTVGPAADDEPVVVSDNVEADKVVHVISDVVVPEVTTVKVDVDSEQNPDAEELIVANDEPEVPGPPQILVPDHSQEVQETPPPVIVSSEVVVQPEPPQPSQEPVESTVAPSQEPESVVADEPYVHPTPGEVVHDEPPVVYVEIDSLYPGVQADEPVHSEDDAGNELGDEPIKVELNSEVQQEAVVPTEQPTAETVVVELKNQESKPVNLVEEPINTNVDVGNVDKFTSSHENNNVKEASPEVVAPGDVIVANPEFIVVSDAIVPIPSIILEPPQHDFQENQIVQSSKPEVDEGPKISVYLKPSSEAELVFQPVILSHVKPLADSAEQDVTSAPHALVPEVPAVETVQPATDSPAVVVNDDVSAETKPTDVPHPETPEAVILQDDVVGNDEVLEQTTTGVVVPSANLKSVESTSAGQNDVVQVPTNPLHILTKDGELNEVQSAPEDPIVVSDDASPVFDERPTEVQSTDPELVQPVVEEVKYVDLSGVVPTESPTAEVVHDEVPQVTDAPVPATVEPKYRLDMSIFDDSSDDTTQRDENSEVQTTTSAPLRAIELVQEDNVDKGKSDAVTTAVPTVAPISGDNELVFDEVNHVAEVTTEVVVQRDDIERETTTFSPVKSRADEEHSETTTFRAPENLERKESETEAPVTVQELQDPTETPAPEVVHDDPEPEMNPTQFDLSQRHHHYSDSVDQEQFDETTTGQPIVVIKNLKDTKKAVVSKKQNESLEVSTETVLEDEVTTTEASSFEDRDDTVIIDRAEPSPKFRMPTEMVNKVEPISDDISENVKGKGVERSDLTVQQEADNEVANAEETWFWRTFNRVRTMPLFLPAAPSARRPRSVPQETDNKLVNKEEPKKDSRTEKDSHKGWASWARFLLW